ASAQRTISLTEVVKQDWACILIRLPETAFQAEYVTDKERLDFIHQLLDHYADFSSSEKREFAILVPRCLQYLPKTTVLSDPLFESICRNSPEYSNWLMLLASFALSSKQKKALIPLIA